MKQKLSMFLILALLITSLPLNNVFASSNHNENIIISEEVSDDMILVNTDTITVQDDEGNKINIIVEEYEETKNVGISPRGMYKEYPIGTKKTWVFKVTNEQLGITGIATGVPLSKAAKKKLASIVAKAIGEKIASATVPVLGWTSWLLKSSGIVNAAVGNKGFKLSISGVYTETYYNAGGYYVYAWNLKKPSVSTY